MNQQSMGQEQEGVWTDEIIRFLFHLFFEEVIIIYELAYTFDVNVYAM